MHYPKLGYYYEQISRHYQIQQKIDVQHLPHVPWSSGYIAGNNLSHRHSFWPRTAWPSLTYGPHMHILLPHTGHAD
jgi:hypothetical protein